MKTNINDLGKKIPIELYETILDSGNQAIFEYLQKNNAPKQLIDLSGQVVILAQYVEKCKTNSMSEDEPGYTLELLPEISNNILSLGYDLDSGVSGVINKHEIVKWVNK